VRPFSSGQDSPKEINNDHYGVTQLDSITKMGKYRVWKEG
jgi:hypothetical protein